MQKWTSYFVTAPNLLWWTAQAPGYRRFRAALANPATAQERILSRILRCNADTAFGRAHGFAQIRTPADYRRRVALSTYDDYHTFIERILGGEQAVLTREPVRRLVPSSGSTRAAKLIPYTATLHREFAAGIAPWLFDLYRRDPGLLAGPAYWSITPSLPPPEMRTTVPIGYDSDTSYLAGPLQRLVDASMAVPSKVSRIQDMDSFRRTTLRWLLAARELRLISVWHPSFLALLLDRMAMLWDDLLRDLPDPRRAAEMRECGPRETQRIWPRLRLVSCWADGAAALHVGGLVRRFPGVRIQPKGLLATEAFVSLPLGDDMPVAVRSHFFEFADDAGRFHLVQELEPSGVYSVIVTTGGGLYRYRLQDRVRVTGFVGRTPSIRFLGKEDHIADLFGEKLHEGFVTDVLGRLFRECGVQPGFALVAPDTTDGHTGYTLFVEVDGRLPEGFARRLESSLRENPHYGHCVALGQLSPARAYRIAHGAYAAYAKRCVEQGQRLGNVKATCLSRVAGWSEVFVGDYLA